MKTCSKCKELKEDHCFYKYARGGLYSWCKSCVISESRKRKARLRLDTRDIPTQYNGRRNDTILKIRKQDLKNKSTCAIIHDHHETLKNDPDHLTTDFIQKIVGRKC